MRSGRTLIAPMEFVREVPHNPSSAFEIGANSLKCHRLDGGKIETVKFSYDLGHEVYRTRHIAKSTIFEVTSIVAEQAVQPAFAIGTSAVRDADNGDELVGQLHAKLHIAVHILTPFEEASLLARDFLDRTGERPALILDVGGGSVEIVYVNAGGEILWESLSLGVIRLYHKGQREGRARQLDWIHSQLKNASAPVVDHGYSTGGTVKAMAEVTGKATLHREDVAELEARVLAEGPPPGLAPKRAELFPIGVTLVHKLFDFTQVRSLTYMNVSIGQRALRDCLTATA